MFRNAISQKKKKIFHTLFPTKLSETVPPNKQHEMEEEKASAEERVEGHPRKPMKGDAPGRGLRRP